MNRHTSLEDQDARESRKRADFIAALQPTPDPASLAADQAMMAGMLRAAVHKRECHTLGHRGCARCSEENCQACKVESLERWDAVKGRLDRLADRILDGGIAHPSEHGPKSKVAVLIALFLTLE